FRQIDTGRAARPTLGRMHRRRGGVAEQIEETLACRFALDAQAQRTMIEKQAGIQIVGEIDQQLDAAFADLEKLALTGLALVLARTALPFTALDHDLLTRNTQRLGDGTQRVEQPRLGFLRIDRTWRCVLLHMHPVAVQVDGEGILGHVRVVQAIALDALPTRPLAELTQVFLQAIGEHLPAFAEKRQRYGLLGLGRTLIRRRTLTGDELIQLDLDQQQLARQRAVPECVLLVAANAHAPPQFRRRGEDAGFPAQAGLPQTLTQVLVEINQARLVTQALAVGWVADHQALLILIRTRFESRHVTLIDPDPTGQPRALDVVAGWLDQARIGLIAANPQRWPGQPSLCTGQGLGMQTIPKRRHVPEPGAEVPTLATQVRRDIRRHQRPLDEKGTHPAHGIDQRPAGGCDAWPSLADQHRSGKVLLQGCGALLKAIAALMQAVPRQ